MKISVIIPVYNTDHGYLRDCLTSLMTQDFTDFEVIAVNDGSVNGCDRVLKEFAERYDSMVFVDQENGGTSVARNTGLEKASGDYIMFVDADDFVSPGCLRTVYEAMEEILPDLKVYVTDGNTQTLLPLDSFSGSPTVSDAAGTEGGNR